MLIVVFAAAMCLAMLIATAIAMHEEAGRTKVEIRRNAIKLFPAQNDGASHFRN